MLRPTQGGRRSLTVERRSREVVLNNSSQSTQTSVGGLGGERLPRRTSSGAQALLVPRPRQRNASSTSSQGRAWRIRIGKTETKRQREGFSRCGFLFFASFSRGCLVGKKACLSLPPDWPQGHEDNGSVAQLDRASHYGCEGLGFESLQGHERSLVATATGLFCARQV